MDHEQQEILRHAVIGGLVAVALASFHEIAETVAKDRLRGQTTWILASEWSALFVLVFAAILMVEFYLRRRQWKAKIRLDEVGWVDGRWLDALIVDGEVKGSAILEISSAAGEGFHIKGTAYDVGPNGIDRNSKGTFYSTHGSLFARSGVAYVFEGVTSTGREHFGVGYYRFSRQSNLQPLRSEGAFLARQEDKAFHTIGARLNEGRPNSLRDDEALAIMDAFIKRPDVVALAASHCAGPR